jgi:hypothetical protein
VAGTTLVAVGSIPGIGDGPGVAGVAVSTLVAVGLGTRVLVAVGRAVAVGVLVFGFGKSEGLPGNVNAMISTILEKPSPSESNDSIAPRLAMLRGGGSFIPKASL